MMDPLSSTDILSFLSNLIGAIGGVLGIASWVTGYQREKRMQREEDERWELLGTFAKAAAKHSGGRLSFDPQPGSHEYRLAEQLVEKGMLKRSPLGGYWLPDA